MVAEILQLEILQVPPFFTKKNFLKGHISKTIAPILIKLKLLAFFIKLNKQTKFHAKLKILGLIALSNLR